MYNFDTAQDRTNTASAKWKKMFEANPNVDQGVIPLSTADMELETAPEIYEGLQDYLAKRPILGYNFATEKYLNSVVDWMKKRHDWTIEPEWIVNSPGVVGAFYAAIQAFSEKDDGVIIFRPVYYPFGKAIDDNRRTEVNVPLIEEDNYYTIDFEAFEEAAAKPENKILLFCSPHNPVGRVWTEDELAKVADIAIKHDLFVISDDIWSDLISPGFEHTFMPKVDERIQDRIVVNTAASKSFNLAGLHTSNNIVPNEEVREKFKEALENERLNMVGMLGLEGTRLAYTKGEAWFDEVNEFIYQNKQFVKEYFEEHYPKVKAPITEGTYIQWIDFREVDMDDDERVELLEQKAQFFTDTGPVFGQEGSGFERINVALPTKKLKEALDRLVSELKKADK